MSSLVQRLYIAGSGNKTYIWGMGLHGVVVSLARRKADEFDSHILHHPNFGIKQSNVSPIIFIYSIKQRRNNLGLKRESI